MAIHRIERAQWQPYFDYISHLLHDDPAEVEVVKLPNGKSTDHQWTRLNSLTYHPREDVLKIAANGTDYQIARPKDIYVDDAGATFRTVDVIDADGNHQIVQLREPMPLSIPQ